MSKYKFKDKLVTIASKRSPFYGIKARASFPVPDSINGGIKYEVGLLDENDRLYKNLVVNEKFLELA